MFRLAALTLALFSSAAGAAPVYLTCVGDPGGPGDSAPEPMNVAVDEERGTVTYGYIHYGPTATVPAVFTADKVAFGDHYVIDRTNLDFSTFGAHGTCKIRTVKRAF